MDGLVEEVFVVIVVDVLVSEASSCWYSVSVRSELDNSVVWVFVLLAWVRREGMKPTRSSGALVAPVVVVVGNVKMALVDRSEGIAVADQRRLDFHVSLNSCKLRGKSLHLPVVMEVIPRDRDPV